MSLARCRQEVDSREFTDWLADYTIQPWEHGANERAAVICREIVNNAPFRGRGAAQATIEHFMPQPVDKCESGKPAQKTAPQQPKVEMQAQWEYAQARWNKAKD